MDVVERVLNLIIEASEQLTSEDVDTQLGRTKQGRHVHLYFQDGSSAQVIVTRRTPRMRTSI